MSSADHVARDDRVAFAGHSSEPHTTFSETPLPHAVPCRLTALKIRPSVTSAASIHRSTALFTQTGTGTVRTWPPFPTRSTIAQCPLVDLDVFFPKGHQFCSSESAFEQDGDRGHVTCATEAFAI